MSKCVLEVDIWITYGKISGHIQENRIVCKWNVYEHWNRKWQLHWEIGHILWVMCMCVWIIGSLETMWFILNLADTNSAIFNSTRCQYVGQKLNLVKERKKYAKYFNINCQSRCLNNALQHSVNDRTPYFLSFIFSCRLVFFFLSLYLSIFLMLCGVLSPALDALPCIRIQHFLVR